MNIQKILLVLCASMMLAATANAAIIYDVNRTIGAGTVTGFIETDETLGVLSVGNITDWMFTLTAPNLDGGSPDVISFATQNQTVLFGGLTATSTDLLFDFDQSGSLLLFQGATTNYWCLENIGCTGQGQGEHMGFGTSGVTAQTVVLSGNVVIASVSGVSVPEPATLMLLGLGLAALGFTRRGA